MNWEQIDAYHERAEVHGGWLVKAYSEVSNFSDDGRLLHQGYDLRIAMTFVPDPQHVWRLNNVSTK